MVGIHFPVYMLGTPWWVYTSLYMPLPTTPRVHPTYPPSVRATRLPPVLWRVYSDEALGSA